MLVTQLTIDFAVDNDATFANFYSIGNEALVSQLNAFVEQDTAQASESLFYMHSSSGTGKTHLLHALCQAASEQKLNCQYLPMKAFCSYDTEVTLGMEQADILCIDDIDAIKLFPDWQQAIFDLINRVLEQGNKIIFCAKQPAADVGFSLPDLLSRLQWGQIWRIMPLDEEGQLAMMMFRAKCKGMTLSYDVAKYLHLRLSRDSSSIMQCLERLDKSSLEAQRRLTIPFIKQLMRW